MKLGKLGSILLFSGFLMMSATNAHAVSSYYNVLTAQYGSNTGCGVCHSGGPGTWRPYGLAYMSASGDVATKIVTAGNQTNPDTTNTFGQDIQTGGILPDSNSGEEEEGFEACMAPSSMTFMMLFTMLTLGLFIRRK